MPAKLVPTASTNGGRPQTKQCGSGTSRCTRSLRKPFAICPHVASIERRKTHAAVTAMCGLPTDASPKVTHKKCGAWHRTWDQCQRDSRKLNQVAKMDVSRWCRGPRASHSANAIPSYCMHSEREKQMEAFVKEALAAAIEIDQTVRPGIDPPRRGPGSGDRPGLLDSAFPFGSSFDSERGVLEQMRGRRSRERKLSPARVTDPARRHAMTAEAAYYRAERRGSPGHELDDWLQAEADVARRAGRSVRRP